MQEMVSCCVAVSNKPNPLRPAFSNKQSACEPKPNCFHLAQLGTMSSAKPGGPKQPPISTNGLRRRDFGRLNNRSSSSPKTLALAQRVTGAFNLASGTTRAHQRSNLR
jgi:hypothetical protein